MLHFLCVLAWTVALASCGGQPNREDTVELPHQMDGMSVATDVALSASSASIRTSTMLDMEWDDAATLWPVVHTVGGLGGEIPIGR